jgi:hypothetical protein
MSKKSIIALALLIIAPIVLYFLWPSDENRIKKLFRQGAKAVEEENIEEIMSKVSFTYTDEHGLSYILLKNNLPRFFQQLDNFSVEYEIRDIRINDKTATAEVDISVIASRGEETGYIIGDAGTPATAFFTLEKERAKWLVAKTKGIPVYY